MPGEGGHFKSSIVDLKGDQNIPRNILVISPSYLTGPKRFERKTRMQKQLGDYSKMREGTQDYNRNA